MKQIENIFRILCLSVLGMFAGSAAYAEPQSPHAMDSVEISLLTCTPHEEIYSLYGHSAIRYVDYRTREDCVYSYGIFNYKKPHFVWRFIFGLTDYELGINTTRGFCQYYYDWGSEVSEQVLNLTPEEKLRIKHALDVNMLPENREYRYNFFCDNCATRPRDLIEQNLNGKILYAERKGYEPTYREMIHEHTVQHPWAAFGNDLLLGVKADLKTTQREQEFLPENLQFDFAHAQIERDGQREPLVKATRVLIPAGVQSVAPGFPLSPLVCALLLWLISMIIFVLERGRNFICRWFDVLVMLVTGVAGCIIALMFFSEHPTTSTNLQILLLNPLPLIYIYKVARGKKTHWFKLNAVLIMLFLIGGFWQDYADGMEIVALCLLTRCWIHRHDK